MSQTPLLVRQLNAQRARGEAPFAIFTDLDCTFVVEGNAAAADAAGQLFEQAAAADWPLIAITGRGSARLQRELAQGVLPPFSALIGAAGTEILLRQGASSYIPDKTYATQMRRLFSRSSVLRTAKQLISDHSGANLCLQPGVAELYKVSLHFLAASHKACADIAAPFRQAFPKLKIIICEEIYYNAKHRQGPRRYNLDIVPANKSDAVRYLMDAYGIQCGLVAGDSGNDVDALLMPGLAGVLVGGHRPEAAHALAAHAAASDIFIDTDPARVGAQSILHVLDMLPTRAGTAQRPVAPKS